MVNVLTNTDRLNLFSHKRLYVFGSLLLLVLLFNLGQIAEAAPLSYSEATDITLSSVGRTITISAGSVADEVIIGATSLTVTVSASTGGDFTVTSATKLVSSPDNINVAKGCSGGTHIASLVFSAADTYVITTAAGDCSAGGASGSSSGSSETTVATTASTPVPVVTTPPVVATTTVVVPVVKAPVASVALSAQQQLLNTLIASLKLLLQQASSQGIKLPAGAETYLTPASLVNIKDASRNLSVSAVGDDVKSLQEFLNSHGFAVAASGPGSPGSETTRFGGLTKAALAKFQKSVGISPASGMFGPLTRSYIKNNY